MIFKIAKTELRSIFFSPVAWFVSIVFLFMWGTNYGEVILGLANLQEMAIRFSPNFKNFGSLQREFSLTTMIFGSIDEQGNGIFKIAVKYLFLFVPLLTMGLISREMNSGTDKLLYSSPIRLRQIVLGKYLGMMIYNLFLLMFIVVFFIASAFSVKAPDIGFMFSAATSIFLLMCTYSAIGMFMSSLTGYQVVSAIGAFVVLGILNSIGDLWQRVDFVRDLTWFLSLPGRAEKMLYGLITTKDLIYFILVTAMFVCFTIFRLKGQRETKPWYFKAARYSMVFGIVLCIGYISSRPALTGYWDATANYRNTISEKSQQLIKQLDKGPLEVTVYTNLLGENFRYGLPENRNSYISKVWDPYLRFKPDIHFNFVYFYDINDDPRYPTDETQLKKKVAAIAKSVGLDLSLVKKPEEIRKMIDLGDEKFGAVVQLKYGEKTSFLRTFSYFEKTFDQVVTPQKREQIIAASFKKLLQPAPTIYFISGHYERSIYKLGERELAGHTLLGASANALSNHGFEIDTLSLVTSDIPKDASALVLADPKVNLGTEELNKLQQYISAGGNMLILGEPGKQFVLNPLLRQLGVQLMNGQIAQPSKDETPDKVTPFALNTVTGISAALADVYKMNASYGKTVSLMMPGVTAISSTPDSAFAVNPLLVTAEKMSWLKAGKLVTDSAEVFFSPAEGDVDASLPVAMGLTRQVKGKEQRIALVGDADFLGNQRLESMGNLDFTNGIYSWMSYGEFPIYAPKPDPEDNLLYVSKRSANIQKIIFVWVLPEILLVFAIIFLIRRKRK